MSTPHCIGGEPPRAPVRHVFQLLLALLCMALLAGCNGSDDPPVDGPGAAPAGLSYSMPSAVYETGRPIVPNRPSASGGAIERYTIAPPLPPGLALDETTGVIAGTPTSDTAGGVHVVTARNGAGSATARVAIAVRPGVAAPAGLVYREVDTIYVVGEPLAANVPTSSGGPIERYTISPSLPAGLTFDTGTGEIGGTPSVTAVAASYVITGTNAAGSATATLRIAVEAALQPPASLGYSTPIAVYVTAESIVPNSPSLSGGAATMFAVTPALPAGLSLNTSTGVISGTPTAMQAAVSYTVSASNRAGSAHALVQISVSSRGNWAAVPSLPAAAYDLTATVLTDGKILATGGTDSVGSVTRSAIYDPQLNTWTAVAAMAYPRSAHAATRLPDGRVLVTGGAIAWSNATDTAEMFDPATGAWTPVAPMHEARERHTATLLPDGRVLVTGGYAILPALTSRTSAEIYDPASNTWTLMNTRLAEGRAMHAAELLPGGTAVLLMGGMRANDYLTSAERLQLDDTGTTLEPFPASSMVTQSVLLRSGKILALTDDSILAWLYDPATARWASSTRNSMRSEPMPVLLADGRVLLAGGYNGPATLASVEVYDPDANAWTVAASMSVARAQGDAVPLADGSTLIIGGQDGTQQLSSVERYRP